MTAKTKRVLAAAVALIVIAAGWKFLAGEKAVETRAGPRVSALRGDADEAARAPTTRATPITTTPFVDGASTHPAEGLLATFRILEHDGVAVGGSTCVLGRADTRLGYGDTDAAGAITFPASDAGAWLLVLAPARPPYRCDVVPTAGTHVVQLPAETVINGHVTVDDQPPGEALTVFLSRSGRPPALAGLDDALRLGDATWLGKHDIKTTAAADGRFRFKGVTEAEVEHAAIYLHVDDWRFELVPSEQAASMVNGQQRVPFPTPEVTLRLIRSPQLTGRLVRPDRSGVAGATLLVAGFGGAGGAVASLPCGATLEDGRFAVPLRKVYDARRAATAPTKVRLDFTPRGGTEFEQSFDGDFSTSRDVGDIVMTDSWPVVFHLRDDAGKPIAGALTSHSFGVGAGSLRSDAAGEVRLQLDAEHRSVSFGAAGFIEQSIEPPERPTEPITVVLRRGGRLEVTVTYRDGRPPRGCFIALDAKLGGNRHQSNFDTFLSRPPGNWNPVEGGRFWRWSQPAPADGLLGVQGFKEGDVVTVTATDQIGESGGGAPREVTILPNQITKVALNVEASERRFACRVVGPAGEACEDPWVTLAPSSQRKHPNPRGMPRDADGLFQLEGLFAEKVDLVASAKAFGMVTERDVALTTASSVHIMRLVPERTVDVTFVDDAGEPVAVGWVQCNVGGRPIASPRDPATGMLHVTGLGEGTLTVVATVASRPLSFDHPTDKPVARLVVPRPGSVTVRLSSPIDPAATPGERWSVSLRQLDGNRNDGREIGRNNKPPFDRVEFDAVLPGRYSAGLRRLVGGKAIVESDPVEFDVKAGVATEVTLQRK